MLLNYHAGEDSWESLGQQGDQTNHKGKQAWIFIGRTDAEAEAPILWPLGVKCQFTGKDPDAGKDWGQEEKAPFNFMAVVTVCSDSGAQENKICHCSTFSLPICQEAMEPDTMIFKPVFSSLSPSSRGSLVLHFLSLEWYHLYIWDCYFSWQSWFQLVIHSFWLFPWCTLHVS